jgi:hypothetical protein
MEDGWKRICPRAGVQICQGLNGSLQVELVGLEALRLGLQNTRDLRLELKAVFCRTAREISLKPRKDNFVTEGIYSSAILVN